MDVAGLSLYLGLDNSQELNCQSDVLLDPAVFKLRLWLEWAEAYGFM